jgi:delta-aminolevulinic acid dehydratase/porphobilinogen synthase
VPGAGRAHEQDHDPGRRRRVSALLARLAAECRTDGVRLLVVDIDDRVGLDYVAVVPGLAYLDLSRDLERRSRADQLRYVFDRHYTPATHAVVGEAVAAHLVALGWAQPR